MGLGDIFKATKNKALENRVAELESMLSPEQTELDSLRQSISMAKEQLSTLKNDIGVLEKEKATVDSEIKTAKEKLIETKYSCSPLHCTRHSFNLLLLRNTRKN